MKCPKCGYLGFETTDRCRNCQYDFSLAPFPSEPELTLRDTDRPVESLADFDLPAIKRQTDALSSTALDLDRLFGAVAPKGDAVPAPAMHTPQAVVVKQLEDAIAQIESEIVTPAGAATPVTTPVEPEPEMLEPAEPVSPLDFSEAPMRIESPPADAARHLAATTAADKTALPFDEAPLMPPPAARTPLAVRRATPEVPRNRRRTTRPVKLESLDFEEPPHADADVARAAAETIASLREAPSLGVRVGAGLIDVALLAGLSAAVVYLTLRVTGLQNTFEDLRLLPVVPFVGFLALLIFGYVAAFTVGGGQTIGKMIFNLRVIGDDGRQVDAAGSMLRALGCMLVPVTLGLSYLPALFTSDHRALHDRLAGTRVVQE